MICGDKGFKNKAGRPCGQPIAAEAKSCIWHVPTPEGQRRAQLERMKGGAASRLKRALPADFPEPDFSTPEQVIAFSQRMAGVVLTQDVDPRRVAESRGLANLALTAFSARTQVRMVEALEKLEHGGAAFAFLARLQDGLTTGHRRPTPGRLVALDRHAVEEETPS